MSNPQASRETLGKIAFEAHREYSENFRITWFELSVAGREAWDRAAEAVVVEHKKRHLTY